MTTRRNFIAGSAAVAATLSIPANTAIAADRSEWEAATLRMQEADAAYNAHYENVVQPLEDALDAQLRSNGITRANPYYCDHRREALRDAHDYHAAHDELDRLCSVFSDAETDLLGTSAPDNDVLRWKLDRIMNEEDGSVAPWTGEFIAQTVADYRRLLA